MSTSCYYDEPKELPGCPEPRVDESLLGYLLRLADLNGYRNLRRLFSLLGCRTMPRDITALDYSRLAELTRQPEASLTALSYRLSGRGKREFLGQNIPSFSVEVNRPRLCIDCLDDEFRFRATWDLALMVCCPDHGGYLLSECPECHDQLDWGRPSWHRCACGYDFTSAEIVSAPRDIQEFCRYLRDCFVDEPPKFNLEECSVIDKIVSPQSLMILTAFLGHWSINESHLPLDKMFRGKMMAERASYIHTTIEILKGWPDTFYDFLDRVAGKDPYPESTILMYRDFGRLYYNLMYVYREPDLDFVRTGLKDYDVKRRDDLVGVGLSSEEIKDMGFNGAAKSVDFSASALKKMAQSGGVSFRKLMPVRSSGKIEVTTESRKELADRKKDRVRYMEVVKVLGVRPPMARKLIDEGLLTSDQTVILDGRGNESFYKEEVESLLSELDKMTKPLAGAEDKEKLFPIAKAFHAYGREGFSALRILESVRSGEVAAYKEEGPFDLSRLQVCHRQLSKLVIETVIGEDRGFIDFASALETFELSKSELKTILSHDAVEHIFRPFGGRNYTLIKKSDLEAFMVAHVRSSDIEAAMDKSGRFVRKYFTEQGVYPVWIKIHGDTGIWYKRSDLNKCGLGH